MSSDLGEIVELNVGGVYYTSTLSTLQSEKPSLLAQIFSGENKAKQIQDSKGRYFIDRDGVLFRYVLDYLRNRKLILPENFHERDRLKHEADYYKLPGLIKSIVAPKSGHLPPLQPAVQITKNQNGIKATPAFVTIGYRGTFAFGRDGLADVKFRKLSRIIVCGKVFICRDVFGDLLNESRDPDRGADDRYSSRYFLKNNYLEQAFDCLAEAGFKMVGSCGTSTSANSSDPLKPGTDSEEAKWNHYNEFVFQRE